MAKLKVFTGKALREFFIEHGTKRVHLLLNGKYSILDSFEDIDEEKYFILTRYDFHDATIEEVEIIR